MAFCVSGAGIWRSIITQSVAAADGGNVRTASLIMRFIRFLAVARLSTFLGTMMTKRDTEPPLGRIDIWKKAVVIRFPRPLTRRTRDEGNRRLWGSIPSLYRKFLPAAGPSALQHFLATLGFHSGTESVFTDPFFLFRLVGTLWHSAIIPF
jgi:hypothetical protein